jgi:hypothetical protein
MSSGISSKATLERRNLTVSASLASRGIREENRKTDKRQVDAAKNTVCRAFADKPKTKENSGAFAQVVRRSAGGSSQNCLISLLFVRIVHS